MSFTTIEFAYFALATLVLYFVLPKKAQWVVLLAANIYFYYDTGWKSFLFLVSTVLVSYGVAILIEKSEKNKKKPLVLWGSLFVFLAMFVVMRVSPMAKSIMPLGLSFYSLQCIGYMIEVYRGTTLAERNPLKYFVYISYFPHVLQGPFSDYNQLKNKIFEPHSFDYERVVQGMYRFVWGYMKKRVIADRIGLIVDPVFSVGEGYYGLTVVYVACLYAVQLYADFSGYMDMACGISSMLGIDIQENFNVPYASKSMAEFWRRWHISLGLWFKNYVFYPLLRTTLLTNIRKKMKAKKNKYAMNTIPTVLGLLVNWTLIGLWHGFDWNYLCYDWFCGGVMIVSEILKPVYDKANGLCPKFSASKFADCLRVVRTFFLEAFSFLFFRPDTLAISAIMIRNIFVRPDLKKFLEFGYWNLHWEFITFLPLVILIVVDSLKYRGVNVAEKVHKWPFPIRWCLYIGTIVFLYITQYELAQNTFAYYVF